MVHGDDSATVVVGSKHAQEHKQFLEKNFVCKVRVMGLGPDESREERFLKRSDWICDVSAGFPAPRGLPAPEGLRPSGLFSLPS